MSIYEWKNEYFIGIEEIDAQHRMFFKIINRLMEALQDGGERQIVDAHFEKLMNYTVVHFEAEEGMMKRFGYPGLAEHKKIHDELFAKLAALRDRLEETPGGADNDDRSETIKKIAVFLHGWLSEHITSVDRRYVSYFTEPSGA